VSDGGRRRRIVVVEDDPRLGPTVVAALVRAGWDAVLASDGEAALEEVERVPPDAIVLDLMLPGRSGHELLEAWRDRLSVPVIVLSARTDLPARLGSFTRGAVDYVAKPFFVEELVARLRLRLDDPAPRASRQVELGDVVVDLDARLAHLHGDDLGLTAVEFNVLAALVDRPGRAMSRQQLAEAALPLEGSRLDRAVDSHISRIRRKLGDHAAPIETVFGVGYRFRPAAATS